LAEVNKIFENWTSRKQVIKKVDYNQMVDNILYLSKTYNVGATEDTNLIKQAKVESDVNEGKQGKKKRKR
jgi:hypothetical protein